MNIETKYEVNDMVEHKFTSNDEDTISLYEVKEIRTITCSAGTQNFYVCRHIMMKRRPTFKFVADGKDDAPPRYTIGHGLHDNHDRLAWHQFREDELNPASKDRLSILLTATNPPVDKRTPGHKEDQDTTKDL